MGRLSQAFWYADSEISPTEHEMNCTFSHVSKTTDLKDFRTQVRKDRKEYDTYQEQRRQYHFKEFGIKLGFR